MRMSVVFTLVTAAAPNPWHTRAATSVASESESAHPAEEQQSADVYFPVADDVAESREREERYHDSQLVGVYYPDGVCRRNVQQAAYRRERHVGDGSVEDGERYAECNGQYGP